MDAGNARARGAEYTDTSAQAAQAAQTYHAAGLRSFHGDGYDVSCHCRNYMPRGAERSFDMSDYRSCDSCLHQRGDQKCGLAQQTLQ